MPSVLSSVDNFLQHHKVNIPNAQEMEFQVFVSGDGGDPVEGKRNTWSDGVAEWWHIRVPRDADKEPHFNDYELTWRLDQHAQSIGMTGWNWEKRQSVWVGFDIDSLTGHAEGVGLSDAELREVQEKVQAIPFVEVKRSTSGKGLHLYVYLEDGVETANHTEHAALARAIVGVMSATCGFDLLSSIDCMGAILWVWHRSAAKNAFEIVKAAERKFSLAELPENWKDNVAPIPSYDPPKELPDAWELISELCEQRCPKTYIQGNRIVTHVTVLADVLSSLGYEHDIVWQGTDLASPNGAAHINANFHVHTRHYNDKNNWQLTLLTDFDSACSASGGVVGRPGEYTFSDTKSAQRAACVLHGKVQATPDGRPVTLRRDKDRVFAIVAKHGKSDAIPGYSSVPTARDQRHEVSITERQSGECFDDVVRFVTNEGASDGRWLCKTENGDWINTTSSDTSDVLASLGVESITKTKGDLIRRRWTRTSVHGGSEYPEPEKQVWNLDGWQRPKERPGEHPHCTGIIEHLGKSLQSGIDRCQWCQQHAVDGTTYMLYWIALIYQDPYQLLPMIGLWSRKHGTGKSMFGVLLRMLFPRHTINGFRAISENHNGQLAYQIIVLFEERDLNRIDQAPSILRDLITGRTLPIREMHRTEYETKNSLHLVQMCNDPTYFAIDPGDRRQTISDCVSDLASEIQEDELIRRLESELPAFAFTLANIEVPPCETQLRLPTLTTDTKLSLMAGHEPPANDFDAQLRLAIDSCGLEQATATELCDMLTDPKPTPQKLGLAMKRLGYIQDSSRRYQLAT